LTEAFAHANGAPAAAREHLVKSCRMDRKRNVKTLKT
jgi:hypothetical protein